jgi:hypothetical protein
MGRSKKAAIAREPGFQIEVCPVEGAEMLVTIGPLDPIWGSDGQQQPVKKFGRFVRVQPPADATDEQIERVRELAILFGFGAVKVVVQPRRRAAVITLPKEGRRLHQTARAVVGQLVDESNVEDRAALQQFVEQVMGKEGL